MQSTQLSPGRIAYFTPKYSCEIVQNFSEATGVAEGRLKTIPGSKCSDTMPSSSVVKFPGLIVVLLPPVTTSGAYWRWVLVMSCIYALDSKNLSKTYYIWLSCITAFPWPKCNQWSQESIDNAATTAYCIQEIQRLGRTEREWNHHVV